MKLSKIILLILIVSEMQNITAKRMESSLFVKQTIDKAIEALEKDVKALEQARDTKLPEGVQILPLSTDEVRSVDNGIVKLKAAIDILRS